MQASSDYFYLVTIYLNLYFNRLITLDILRIVVRAHGLAVHPMGQHNVIKSQPREMLY